jgi:hypothetical protein
VHPLRCITRAVQRDTEVAEHPPARPTNDDQRKKNVLEVGLGVTESLVLLLRRNGDGLRPVEHVFEGAHAEFLRGTWIVGSIRREYFL